MKNKETIEETAENWLNKDGFNIYNHYDTRPSFIAGAKWQMNKQDSFIIGFIEWLNEIQSFHSGENAYYFQGKWYSYKEILEFYKNMLQR